MRLLNARTKQFEEFFSRKPKYAILSHTWGSNELTFKHMEQNGYVPSRKIDGCCEQALRDGLKYVWVDTCCIDKSSSAELSEAINSMYTWYSEAEVCYAYLSDVPHGSDVYEKDSAFVRSRWFSRGWTLQELIAPRSVEFYDQVWTLIGQKRRHTDSVPFMRHLSETTKIDFDLLYSGRQLSSFSFARRMSWASHRTTTRVEDMAYSLLGIFEINMPLLYGEGGKAFKRLQEEIIKISDDESVFAWGLGNTLRNCRGSLLASSPCHFENCSNIICQTPAEIKPSHYTLTNKGLHIEASIVELPIGRGILLARLNCSATGPIGSGKCLALLLVRWGENDMMLTRFCATPPVLISEKFFLHSRRTHVYIHRSIWDSPPPRTFSSGLWVRSEYIASAKITEVYPPVWLEGLFERILKEQPQNLMSEYQQIVFLIENQRDQNYAVWFNYAYKIEVNTSSLAQYLVQYLIPQKLEIKGAFIKKGKTLAEAILESEGRLESALSWQEVLDLGDSNLCFDVAELVGLDGRPFWIIQIEVKKKETLGRG